jgi:hypothetical protein
MFKFKDGQKVYIGENITGTHCNLTIYFAVSLVYCAHFGLLYQEKSGNPWIAAIHPSLSVCQGFGFEKAHVICS